MDIARDVGAKSELIVGDRRLIGGLNGQYGSARVTVVRHLKERAVLIERNHGPGVVSGVENLGEDHFAALLSTDPEMIILGTGDRNVFPPRELTFALARKGIGLEVMDTPAAARTFNVLAGEGRRLAALLYV